MTDNPWNGGDRLPEEDEPGTATDALNYLCEQLDELWGAGFVPQPAAGAATVTMAGLCQILDALGNEIPDWVAAHALAGDDEEADADTISVQVRFELRVPASWVDADGVTAEGIDNVCALLPPGTDDIAIGLDS